MWITIGVVDFTLKESNQNFSQEKSFQWILTVWRRVVYYFIFTFDPGHFSLCLWLLKLTYHVIEPRCFWEQLVQLQPFTTSLPWIIVAIFLFRKWNTEKFFSPFSFSYLLVSFGTWSVHKVVLSHLLISDDSI